MLNIQIILTVITLRGLLMVKWGKGLSQAFHSIILRFPGQWEAGTQIFIAYRWPHPKDQVVPVGLTERWEENET